MREVFIHLHNGVKMIVCMSVDSLAQYDNPYKEYQWVGVPHETIIREISRADAV